MLVSKTIIKSEEGSIEREQRGSGGERSEERKDYNLVQACSRICGVIVNPVQFNYKREALTKGRCMLYNVSTRGVLLKIMFRSPFKSLEYRVVSEDVGSLGNMNYAKFKTRMIYLK